MPSLWNVKSIFEYLAMSVFQSNKVGVGRRAKNGLPIDNRILILESRVLPTVIPAYGIGVAADPPFRQDGSLQTDRYPMIIGGDAVGGGPDAHIYTWNGSDWQLMPGAGVQVAPSGSGAWMTNASHVIYHWSGSSWDPQPAAARQIAVGADGTRCAIGTNAIGSDFGIYRWDGSTWQNLGGGGVRIAVDPSGNPWIVNAAHAIFHFEGNTWVQKPGAAQDVAVGGNGDVYTIGMNPIGNGDYGVYRWTGSTWQNMGGGGVAIAVSNLGTAYVVNAAHDVYKGPNWTLFSKGSYSNPTLSVTAAGGVYNSNPYAASATVAGTDGIAGSTLQGVGLTLTYYSGSAATGSPLAGVPSAAGTYTVLVSFPGSGDYASASTTKTYTISKASPTLSLIAADGVYNTNPYAASATVAGIDGVAGTTLEGVGLTLAFYSGSTATGSPLAGAPSLVGTYTVVSSYAGSSDYSSASSNPITFSIGKAIPTLSVNAAGGVYNGNPYAASAAVTGADGVSGSSLEGVGLTLTYYFGTDTTGAPLAGAPSTSGTYTVLVSFLGSSDYTSASTTKTYAIGKATPTLSVTAAGGVYNGNPYAASATVAGADGVAGSTLEGSGLILTYFSGPTVAGSPLSGAPSAAGVYTVLVSFLGSVDYVSASTTKTYIISPVTSTVGSSIGVFRNGAFYLDSNKNGVWNSTGDGYFAFGNSTDVPIAGDWNGDGVTEIGVFRNGTFYLDMNGNHKWDSASDTFFTFGNSTDKPITGDWNGDGKTDVGVFRSGSFFLDANGSRSWNAGDVSFAFGNSNDLPVTGDWNGDGKTDVGVFRSGSFFLDANGSRSWNAGDVSFAFGNSNDLPVTGDWNGDGKTDVGVFRGGNFYLDQNGNRKWDSSIDKVYQFGTTGDKPIVGNWTATSAPASLVITNATHTATTTLDLPGTAPAPSLKTGIKTRWSTN